MQVQPLCHLCKMHPAQIIHSCGWSCVKGRLLIKHAEHIMFCVGTVHVSCIMTAIVTCKSQANENKHSGMVCRLNR